MRVGCVDIGTNTVRLLIADVSHGQITSIGRSSVVVGLGHGVDSTRLLSPDGVDRALAALHGFGVRLHEAGVEVRAAVATSASRDAIDAPAFLERVADVIGVEVALISGEEEAELSFRGAASGLPDLRPLLVIDPGGGSTEFVLGHTQPEYSVSVDIGSVRLSDRMLPDRPATADQVAAAAAHVVDLLGQVALPGPPAQSVGVGGTFTTLAAMTLALDGSPSGDVDGAMLTEERLDELVAMLTPLTVEETAALPSLDPARAPILLGGAIVAAEVTRLVGSGSVVVSEKDLLDGLALRLAAQE
jgi:exopolyphosphatase / guanosine-5'-triphosphate,3'-diphosphate pyrophosphatase